MKGGNDDGWFAELEASVPGSAARLRAFVDGCAGPGVTRSARTVLVVRIAGPAGIVEALGFGPSGDVQVPWMISGHKAASRDFALAIAGAIPGAVAYENAKMWTVRAEHLVRRPPLRIGEVLDAAEEVRAAVLALAGSIGGAGTP